ncbi:MAG: OmpH family outer membrane protein [Caulobacteraceae bacterium]
MMKTTSLALAGVAGVATLGAATMAFAQAKPAAPAPRPAAAPAAPAPTGPTITASIPGVCVLSREGIVGSSTVGKFVQTRLQQLTTQTNAELTGEQTALQNDAKSLEAKKATLAPAAYQQQGASLQQRADALQQKAQLRDRELQATEQKAVQRVLQEATPFVGEQVEAKKCGVILDANSVLGANQNMDLTGGVIAALNAKVTQFTFDRERLDGQPVAQQR